MPPEQLQSREQIMQENQWMYDSLAETGEHSRSCAAGGRIYEKFGWVGLHDLAEPVFEAAELLMRDHPYVANRLPKGLLQ
jgi:hypothetical protein